MTQNNYISMTIIGVVVWFAAALLIRYYETMLFGAPSQNLAILYAATIPVCYVSVLIAQKLAKLSAQSLCAGLCVGNAATLLLDGLALVWAPQLYSMAASPVPCRSSLVALGRMLAARFGGYYLAAAIVSSKRQTT